jgi:transposase
MTPQVQVYLAAEPVDLRGSFDKLAAVTRNVLNLDPSCGALFLFSNRARNRLKALWWDSNGYIVLYKRLCRGSFTLPDLTGSKARSMQISRGEFSTILAAVGVVVVQKLH